MTAALFLGAGPLLFNQLFPPVPLTEQVQHTPVLIFSVLDFCLATAYLALWWVARDYRVFRTIGLFFALVGVELFGQYFVGFDVTWTLSPVAVALLVEAAAEAMHIRNRRWTRLFWPIYLFAFIAGRFSSMAFVREWPVLFSEAALAILIIMGFRRGNAQDRMIAAAFSVHFLMRLTLSPSFVSLTGFRSFATIRGWQWQYVAITTTLLGAMTLAIFVRELIFDRREKQRLAAELEAARSVQQVLIPDDIPTVPGFAIQSVYKPAGQVGGDFFQILPTKNGGVLVVIGDVSGKGMPAAMTVSLLVGTVRTLAHYTESPGEILAAMNARMLTRSQGGFTTCLVLRADADGTVTVANAGHIAPYLAGKELTLENGLPLGLAAKVTYADSIFQLAPAEPLTLLTDGVVEAREKAGALFGFERTAALSTQPAEAIAAAAQAFGQEDDITVLSITRTPDLNPAPALLVTSV